MLSISFFLFFSYDQNDFLGLMVSLFCHFLFWVGDFFFFLSFLKVILVNCFVGGLKLIDWCEGRHGKAILDQS